MDLAEVAEKIREAIGLEGFLIVVGKMEISYMGRASLILGSGDHAPIYLHPQLKL